jgi:hypothetical protein
VLFQLQLLATGVMTGVIWFVQIVQYPMFADVGREAFVRYHRIYCQRITQIVGPCMAVEAVTALACWWLDPLGHAAHRYGLMLLAVLWISTAAVQIPIHNRLEKGYCPIWGRRLVLSNWLRTAAWSARMVILVGLISQGTG